MRFPGLVLTLFLCLIAMRDARAEAPANTPHERALSLHDEARVLYEEGHYREAIAKLEVALELDPTGKELVYNLALIHEKLADIEAAERFYLRYLEMEDDPKQHERVLATLRRIEGAKAELGKAESPLAETLASTEKKDARSTRTSVEPRAAALGGIALAAFTVGAVFGIRAIAIHPGDAAETNAQVSVDQLESDARAAHTSAVVADVSFAVAIAATVVAGYFQLTAPSRTKTQGQSFRRSPSREATWALSF